MPRVASRRQRETHKGKFGGQVDNRSPFAMPEGAATLAQEVEFTTRGQVQKKGSWFRASSTTDTFTGIFEGENVLLFASTSKLYGYVRNFSPSSAIAILDTGATFAGYWAPCFVRIPEFGIICATTGAGAGFQVIDSVSMAVTVFSFSAPAYAPTLVVPVGAGGSVDAGAHTYRYTYGAGTTVGSTLTTKWGNGSPSAVATTSDPNNKTVTITKSGSEGLPPSGANYVHIFRSTAGTTAPLYWVASVAIATWTSSGYSDTTADSAITGNTQYAANQTAASEMTCVAYSKGRLFCGTRNTSKVYYSDQGEPWYINNSFEANGGYVTGLYKDPGSEQIIIFTEHTIEIVDPTPTTPVHRGLYDNIGCVDGHSIVEANGSLYFAARNGYYRMRGLSVQKISEPISEHVAGLAGYGSFTVNETSFGANPRAVRAVYDRERDRIWFGGIGNTAFYDIAIDQWSVSDSAAPVMIAAAPHLLNASGMKYPIGWYTTGGTTYLVAYATDNTTQFASMTAGYNAAYTTGWLDLGNENVKRFYWFRLFYDKAVAASTSTLTIYIDYMLGRTKGTSGAFTGTETITQNVGNSQQGRLEKALSFRARYVRIRFTQAEANKPFSLDGYEFEYENIPGVH